MIYKKTTKKRGSALVYALVITSATSIILLSLMQYIVSQIKFGYNRVEKEKALQIAESGIYYYRWYLAHQTAGKTAQQVDNFWQNGSPLGVSSKYTAAYEGIGEYEIDVIPPDEGSTIVQVKSVGYTYKEPNMKRTVKVRFRRPSWSEYAVLANDFMRFGEGTDIYGKVHSNKGIRMDGTARNMVTSLVPTFDDPDHGNANEFGVHTHRNAPPASGVNDAFRPLEALPNVAQSRMDVFEAGRQFPVSEVSFNGVLTDLALMKDKASNGETMINDCDADGCYFKDHNNYGRRITLNSNGTMSVCRVSQYDSGSFFSPATYNITKYRRNDNLGNCTTCSGQCAPTIYTIPDDGIIFVEDNVWIEGTINGKKITIASADVSGNPETDIYIGYGNLLYTNFDGSDIIGLVAQRNITAIYGSLDHLTIDAALLAQSGRVGMDHYNGLHKNTLTLNGSIASYNRYGFSYTDGTGYDNRILNFDNNLLYYPPPYFPTGTEYSIDLWEEL